MQAFRKKKFQAKTRKLSINFWGIKVLVVFDEWLGVSLSG